MLSINNISLKFRNFRLENISLQVRENECLSIIGPTGSGKSCILRSVAGVYKVHSGEIFLNDCQIQHLPPEDRNVGLVFQEHTLFPNYNVYENVAFGLRARKMNNETIDKKVQEIADLFKIKHLLHRSIKRLSGGEKQRVALARALVIEPTVLLLDEPFSALDRLIHGQLLVEFKRIFKMKKMMVVHVTHDQDEASVLADRIAVIKDGKIVQLDEVDTIFRQPNCRFVADFVNTQNIFKGKVLANNGDEQIQWDSLRIKCNSINLNGTIQQNSDIQFCIRPEYVHLHQELPKNLKSNVFRCVIKDITTVEAITKIDIKLKDNNQHLMAYEIVRDGSQTGHQIGDEMFVHLNELHVHHFLN